MEETAQYIKKRFFYSQVLDFHNPFKILCHTSKLCYFIKIATVVLNVQHDTCTCSVVESVLYLAKLYFQTMRFQWPLP
jgi:hypothetical protein